jgi:hypothetical protein
MQEVLKSIFLDCDKDRGEGTIEFLISLALRRLKLTDADTKKLLADMSSRFDQHPVARCLSRYIMEQLGGS